ncbi:MAG: ABC transporter ATP-binding protein [Lachnospiraceae bacterium]|nr:ABC transporter ATP-binding protein [Lachnospiraceae bacterium]
MIKLFKNFKESKLEVLFIILLLILQAYCDLALPQFTSDIVDVGIQQSGVENAAFFEVRNETLNALEQFMSQEEIGYVESCYDVKEEGIYIRNTNKKEDLENLDELFSKSMAAFSSQNGQETVSDLMISQKAILFVQKEYEAIGIDLGKIQITYLLIKGAQMLLLSVVMVAAAILVGFLASRTAAKIGRNLRDRVFTKVVSFSNAEIDGFSTASLITRSTNDIQQIQMVSVMLLRMVAYAPILGIGGIIKVSQTNTGMSWIIAVAVGTVILLVSILVNITMPKFKMMQGLVDRLNLVSREILTGIPVIRAFSREKFEEQRFDKANKDLMKTQLFTNRVMTLMMPLMTFIMNGITVLIVWVGAKHIDMGSLQVGDMMAFMTYTMQIVMSFLMLSMISVMLPRAGVAAGRIEEVIQTEATIFDKKETADDKMKEEKGVLAFHHVNFRYPNAKEDVLSDLNFTALPGQTTAIIGSTGCGKSTLLHLIPRFYDVTGGSITIDGVDIRDLSQHKLHSLIGYVPQKGVLFSGNISSNIKFGGKDISDETMKEAAEIAQAEEFIKEKPDGYESEIAQGGTNVSGGQKQRLSIARAIATNPKIYLFDDSFSALDYKTDVTLRKALGKKTKDATVIIVAQRISTILHADKIIVLDEGKITGIGTHEELLASCEEYQEIAKSQLSEAELKGGRQG